MNLDNTRPFEVVLWGATGFVGRLVAEYLWSTYGVGRDVRWAIAGRNPEQLKALRAELGEGAAELPLLRADALDAESMRDLASKTKVICSTVGPYAQYGSPLVRACVEQGTGSCDLCGEPHWIREMIDTYHAQAQQTGARIVSSCGFDSIPSDLGVYFLNTQAQARFGGPCSQVKLRVEHMGGGVSGGTIASMFNVLNTARQDPKIAQLLRDPYALKPSDERSGPDAEDLTVSAYDADLNAWLAPFIMAGINTRIVRRSHALRGYPYGKDFRYDEAVLVGKGAIGRVKAALSSRGLAAFSAAATLTPALLRPLLPKPGQGPSAKQRKEGSFSMLLLGKHDSGDQIRVRVTGDQDPGYGSTSSMLGQSAVCLAKDVDEGVPGGILTPASCMPEALLSRLVNSAGLTFQVVDD